MRCPNCGYYFEISRKIKELRYMLRVNKPLFDELLIDDKWKQDKILFEMERDGLVRLEESKGFIITAKGRDFALSF